MRGLKDTRVVVDPGHGGEHSGAVGNLGLKEKDINLRVALTLGRLLREEGAVVELTRYTDETVTLEDRVKIIRKKKPHIFLSIHHNSCSPRDDSKNQTEVYYPFNLSSPAIDLANILLLHFKDEFRKPVLPPLPATYRVLRSGIDISILSEASYISNPEEEARLQDREYLDSEADIYRCSIKEYLERGVPEIVRMYIRNKTLFAEIKDDGVELEPSLSKLTLDNLPLKFEYQKRRKRLTALLPSGLNNGKHRISLQVWNKNLNRSPEAILHFTVDSPTVISVPTVIFSASDIGKIRINFLDERRKPIKEGKRVSSQIEGGEIIEQDTKTDRKGGISIIFYPKNKSVKFNWSITEHSDSVTLKISKKEGYLYGRVVNQIDKTPLENAEITEGENTSISDKWGYFFISGRGGEYISIKKRGFLTNHSKLERGKEYLLRPFLRRCLLNKTIVIDTLMESHKKKPFPQLHRLSKLSAVSLRRYLEIAGAIVKTRETRADIDSYIERVDFSIRAGSFCAVFLDITEHPPAELMFYERDTMGKHLAENCASFLSLFTSVRDLRYSSSSLYYLVQPYSARVSVMLASKKILNALAKYGERRLSNIIAYSLFLSLILLSKGGRQWS